MAKKRKLVNSLGELRFKLAEMWADFDEGIEVPKAREKIKIADVMVRSIAVQAVQNKVEGVVKAIDFLESPEHKNETRLIDEFVKP